MILRTCFLVTPRKATSILDRLFHRSQIINIDVRSYRLKNFDLIAQDKDKKR